MKHQRVLFKIVGFGGKHSFACSTFPDSIDLLLLAQFFAKSDFACLQLPSSTEHNNYMYAMQVIAAMTLVMFFFIYISFLFYIFIYIYLYLYLFIFILFLFIYFHKLYTELNK